MIILKRVRLPPTVFFLDTFSYTDRNLTLVAQSYITRALRTQFPLPVEVNVYLKGIPSIGLGQ